MLSLPRGPVRVTVRGEGPPLLWSHGIFFPIDVDDESTLGRVLCDAPGFTVIRWDARGHGLTPPAPTADDHRWDRLAHDVLAIADALGLDRFAAGGISMGAAVTLHTALLAPSRVSAMLLLALPTAWDIRPPEQQRYLDLLALGSSKALAAHVQDDLDNLFPNGDLPASLRAMVAHLRGSRWAALSRVITGASRSDLPDRQELEGIAIPTLLRPWANDSGHPMYTAEEVRLAMRGVDWEVLGGFDDEEGMRRALGALLGVVGGAG